jgi:hypothetical protein
MSYPDIYLVKLGKNIKETYLRIAGLCRDLKPGHGEYEAGVLTIRPQRYMGNISKKEINLFNKIVCLLEY